MNERYAPSLRADGRDKRSEAVVYAIARELRGERKVDAARVARLQCTACQPERSFCFP